LAIGFMISLKDPPPFSLARLQLVMGRAKQVHQQDDFIVQQRALSALDLNHNLAADIPSGKLASASELRLGPSAGNTGLLNVGSNNVSNFGMDMAMRHKVGMLQPVKKKKSNAGIPFFLPVRSGPV
jgi:hypothetical protein